MSGDLVYVPGLWRCPKCKFELQQMSLNAQDGTVTARDAPGEKCPNCHVPMWRVSERDARQEAQRSCNEMWENGRRAALNHVADFMMSDAETSCSWYELSEIIRNDRMGDVPTLSEAMRNNLKSEQQERE